MISDPFYGGSFILYLVLSSRFYNQCYQMIKLFDVNKYFSWIGGLYFSCPYLFVLWVVNAKLLGPQDTVNRDTKINRKYQSQVIFQNEISLLRRRTTLLQPDNFLYRLGISCSHRNQPFDSCFYNTPYREHHSHKLLWWF